jgi:hypothetical protein
MFLMFLNRGCLGHIIGGSAMEEGRKCLLENATFKFSSNESGILILKVSIDRDGNVLSSKVVKEGTTITSTPNTMLARNESKKLKFTSGNHYSKFQYAVIQYSFEKGILQNRIR